MIERRTGRRTPPRAVCATATLLLLFGPAGASAQTAERDVADVVSRFHTALASGDSTTALTLLADDVTILESGGVEDKEHYRSGHLAGDMRFAAAVPRQRSDIDVTISGDVAWATSTSTSQGRMGDREINSRGAELMVLSRTGETWLIRAIHWSSRSIR